MNDALTLLCQLIATPAPSGHECERADIIASFLLRHGIKPQHLGNNVWAQSLHFDNLAPTILLNSHLDTVRPCAGWQRDPHTATIEDGKLYGLGSNDAGASVVALATVFVELARERLPYNLVFAATAEEEISGEGGIASLLPQLPPITAAIVGEPTSMRVAIAERGLMVVRCIAEGVAGHAAHGTGINAIDIALDDIAWLHTQPFERTSTALGRVRVTVTMISGGSQHNVVPDRCMFTVDIRTTDAYTHEEILDVLQRQIRSRIESVSLRLRPSRLPEGHIFVRVAEKLGIECYASPTLSDQALLPMPSIKMGPGDSQRSHTADEYITLDELSAGIGGYRHFLLTLADELRHTPTEEQ
ncbi:MAG: M20/M25/M40 family metallo-hydrolase [Chlorobi bacterium]|nr:M20/M25/M40 family metallo-hydrolase [Chlorobiota bacterium]